MWLTAPDHPVLMDGDVHVWRASLDQREASRRKLSELLSEDERLRAGRFHFTKDRDRFVVGRGCLRAIVSRYVAAPPDLLRLSYNRYGKPALETPGNGMLRFNVSHSHDIALYAVTMARDVGVDVEFVNQKFASAEIAERFFSPREVAALHALPHALQVLAFFDCWTRKEAYLKARGEGLSRPLHTFSVSFEPGKPAALLNSDEDPQPARYWSLAELQPGEGYRAALAVQGEIRRLCCWQWTEDPWLLA